MACLDDDTLVDLVDGTVPSAERPPLLRHLESCPSCRRTVARALQLLEPPPTPDPCAPAFTIGRYVVVDWIGEGAMGVVYRAHDPQIDREVALKVVLPELSDPSERTRLLREAQAMGRVSHSNVLAVFDAGIIDGAVFVASELVEGTDLRAFIAARDPGVDVVLDLFRQIALGLAAAHRAGVVHLDVKPDNVLVDAYGRVRVADFGLADAAGTPARGSGTEGYMAPEQRSGGRIDARADQYALCCSLYEALYGRLPATTEPGGSATIEVPARCRRGAVPRAVRHALLRGLSLDPIDRFPDIQAIAEALTRGPTDRSWWLGVSMLPVLVIAIVGFAGVESEAPAAPAEVAGAVPVLPDPDPRLAHARALSLDGQLAEALAEAGSVAAEARRTGNLALLAEAELLRGKLLGPTARLQDATEVLLGAVRTAEAAGRPDLRAEGMLLVAGLEARDPAAGPRATLLLEQARQIIVAQDLHERLGHAADFIEASIDSGAGRYDRAVDGFGRALEGAKRALPPEHPFLDQYRWSLAVALGSVGEHEAAAALYVHSRAEVAAVLGPTSPRFALHLAALGALQVNTGAPEAARVDLEAAVALLRERLGDDAQPTLDVRADLARCLELLGREDEARAHLSDVVSRTLKSGSPASVAEAYADLGDLELRVGALAAATSAYETALSWAQRGAAATSTEARMLTRRSRASRVLNGRRRMESSPS